MDVSRFALLTAKERDCLRASLGRTNDEIARELSISPNTVKTHLANARAKLGGVSRGDAARGLITWEGSHPFQPNLERVMAEPSVERAPVDASSTGRLTDWLPYRTGAHNDLSPFARLVWVFVLAVLGAIGFGSLASGINIVSGFFR